MMSTFWTLDVSRTTFFEITFVCLSIFPTICPSFTKFSQVWIIGFFPDIVHDDSWPWYLVTGKVRFKKKGSLNFGPTGLNQAQNEVFCHFTEFGSYVFLEIVYNDSLWQYLTPCRVKPTKKFWGAQIWAKRHRIGP